MSSNSKTMYFLFYESSEKISGLNNLVKYIFSAGNTGKSLMDFIRYIPNAKQPMLDQQISKTGLHHGRS